MATKLRCVPPMLRTANLSSARVPPKTVASWYLTPEHRAWSKVVIERAGHQCQDCGRSGTRLFADHIVELSDGGARLDPANGAARCGSCHGSKTARLGRRDLPAHDVPRHGERHPNRFRIAGGGVCVSRGLVQL